VGITITEKGIGPQKNAKEIRHEKIAQKKGKAGEKRIGKKGIMTKIKGEGTGKRKGPRS